MRIWFLHYEIVKNNSYFETIESLRFSATSYSVFSPFFHDNIRIVWISIGSFWFSVDCNIFTKNVFQLHASHSLIPAMWIVTVPSRKSLPSFRFRAVVFKQLRWIISFEFFSSVEEDHVYFELEIFSHFDCEFHLVVYRKIVELNDNLIKVLLAGKIFRH